MLHLFRSAGHEDEEIARASRRNDAAYADLREALYRLLDERNAAGRQRATESKE